MSPDEVAEKIVRESIRRGYDKAATVANLSTAIQESSLDPAAVHPNGKWVGVYQQDSSYPGRYQVDTQIGGFLDRLDVKRASSGASADPFLNIFWLQQRPSEPSADEAYRNGRKAYYGEIKRHIDRSIDYFNRFSGEVIPVSAPWSGDPVWLADVLRAEGLEVREMQGWLNRGHGDFGPIWGVMAHHTGSDNASPESIAFHPSLGLCSQIHLARDGKVTLCGVGVAWHAGAGEWPGIANNNANAVTIGIEAANSGGRASDPLVHRSIWPDAQYDAYVKTVAAILRRLGHDSSRLIAHKEWAGRSQGKYDPGQIDMTVMRRDVQAQIDRGRSPAEAEGYSMANVPQEQWDRVYRELTQEHSSRSLYRDPEERPVGTWATLTRNIDAMRHADWVEYCAIQYGDADSIHRIVRTAAGAGADKSEWAVGHAKAVLAQIPAEFLDKYKAAKR